MPSRCRRMVTANTTFRIETDAQGEPLVHRVDGRHPDSHYVGNTYGGAMIDELETECSISMRNIYLTSSLTVGTEVRA